MVKEKKPVFEIGAYVHCEDGEGHEHEGRVVNRASNGYEYVVSTKSGVVLWVNEDRIWLE